jgi:parafibromin
MADTVKEWADAGKLSQAKLSSDGTSLSLEGGGSTLDATQVIEATAEGKTCRYSLASIYLQVLDPNQGLMTYRNACKAHGVKDIVKPLDKPTVVSYFLGADAAAQAVPEKVPSPSSTTKHHPKHKERSSSKHRDKHRSSHKRSHRESSTTSSVEKKSVEKKKKKPKAPMTNEQLFSNLNVVVDKRAATEQSSQEEIHKALSAEGFDVTPELLQQHIASLDLILPLEIPVGNSASILRPATAVDRDFTRVLDLYNETIKPPTSSKHKSKQQQQQHKTKSASSQRSADRAHLIGKKPVIVLPKGMSSPITIANGYEFFANAKFVPRDARKKALQKPPTTFTRKVATRLGGGVMEYEIMDNPSTKLGKDASEWQRIVAVIALGASWQFADWPGQYKEPVHLFGRTYGFYIGMEGDKLPADVEGWAVRKGMLNRDKRGLDSVCYATFWNGLDEWMAIHKPEMLPQTGR